MSEGVPRPPDEDNLNNLFFLIMYYYLFDKVYTIVYTYSGGDNDDKDSQFKELKAEAAGDNK